MDDTSQHNFQNQEHATMSQQINTGGFVKKTTDFNVLIRISMTSSTQQINTGGFVEKRQSLICSLEFL